MDKAQKILDYLEGQMSEAEKQAFETELAQQPELQQELADWQQFFGQLDQFPREAPPIQVDFARLFDKYPQAKRIPPRFYQSWWIAAALAGVVMITGIALLWQQNAFQQQTIALLSREVQDTRQLLAASILQQSSASDKIQVLNTLSQTPMDPELLQALFFALDYDNNVNVRLKAATALESAMNDPMVRQRMIASLGRQQQPEVQILLIDLLAAYREKTAIPVLEAILQQETVMELVKDKAAATLATLL